MIINEKLKTQIETLLIAYQNTLEELLRKLDNELKEYFVIGSNESPTPVSVYSLLEKKLKLTDQSLQLLEKNDKDLSKSDLYHLLDLCDHLGVNHELNTLLHAESSIFQSLAGQFFKEHDKQTTIDMLKDVESSYPHPDFAQKLPKLASELIQAHFPEFDLPLYLHRSIANIETLHLDFTDIKEALIDRLLAVATNNKILDKETEYAKNIIIACADIATHEEKDAHLSAKLLELLNYTQPPTSSFFHHAKKVDLHIAAEKYASQMLHEMKQLFHKKHNFFIPETNRTPDGVAIMKETIKLKKPSIETLTECMSVAKKRLAIENPDRHPNTDDFYEALAKGNLHALVRFNRSGNITTKKMG